MKNNLSINPIKDNLLGGDVIFDEYIKSIKPIENSRSDDYLLKKCHDGSSNFFENNKIPSNVIHTFIEEEVKRIDSEFKKGNKIEVNKNIDIIFIQGNISFKTIDLIFKNIEIFKKGDNFRNKIESTLEKILIPIEIIEKYNLGLKVFGYNYSINQDGKINIINFNYNKTTYQDKNKYIEDHVNKYIETKGITNIFKINNNSIINDIKSFQNVANYIEAHNDDKVFQILNESYGLLVNNEKSNIIYNMGKYNYGNEKISNFINKEFVKMFFNEKKGNVLSYIDLPNNTIIKNIIDIYNKFPNNNILESISNFIKRIDRENQLNDDLINFIIENNIIKFIDLETNWKKDTLVISLVKYFNKKENLSESELDILNSTHNYRILSKHVDNDIKIDILKSITEEYELSTYKTSTKLDTFINDLKVILKPDEFENYFSIILNKLSFDNTVSLFLKLGSFISLNDISDTLKSSVKEKLKNTVSYVSDACIENNIKLFFNLGLLDDENFSNKIVNYVVTSIKRGNNILLKLDSDTLTDIYKKIFSLKNIGLNEIKFIDNKNIIDNIDTIISKGQINYSTLFSFINNSFRFDSKEDIGDLQEVLKKIVYSIDTNDSNNINEDILSIVNIIVNSIKLKKISFNLKMIGTFKNIVNNSPETAEIIFKSLLNIEDVLDNSENMPFFMELFNIPIFKKAFLAKNNYFYRLNITAKNLEDIRKNNLLLNLEFISLFNKSGFNTISKNKIPISLTNLSYSDKKSVAGLLGLIGSFNFSPSEKRELLYNIIKDLNYYSKAIISEIKQSNNDTLISFYLKDILGYLDTNKVEINGDISNIKKLIDSTYSIFLNYEERFLEKSKDAIHNTLENFNSNGFYNLMKNANYYSGKGFLISSKEFIKDNNVKSATKILDDNLEYLNIIGQSYIGDLINGCLLDNPESKELKNIIKSYYKYLSVDQKVDLLIISNYLGIKLIEDELKADPISIISINNLLSRIEESKRLYVNIFNIRRGNFLNDPNKVKSYTIGGSDIIPNSKTLDNVIKSLNDIIPKDIINKIKNNDNSDEYINSLNLISEIFTNNNLSINQEEIKKSTDILVNLLGIDNLFMNYINPIIETNEFSSLKLIGILTKMFNKDGVQKILELLKNKNSSKPNNF